MAMTLRSRQALSFAAVALIVAVAVAGMAIREGSSRIDEDAQARLDRAMAETHGAVSSLFAGAQRAMEAMPASFDAAIGNESQRFGRAVQVADVFEAGFATVWLEATDRHVRPPNDAALPPTGNSWFMQENDLYFSTETPQGRFTGKMLEQRVEGLLLRVASPGLGLELLVAGSPWIAVGAPDGQVRTQTLAPFPFELRGIQSADATDALQRSLVVGTIGTSALFAVLAAGVGVVLGEAVVRPVRAVQGAVMEVRRGNWSARAPLRGPAETRALARDFNVMAEKLQSEHQQLIALQRDLEARVQVRTEELAEAKGQMELFFYGVSHDIKSPIVSIVTLLQLAMRTGQLDEKTRQRLEQAVRASKQLRNLVVELLEFARAGADAPDYEDVSLAALLGSVRDVVDQGAAHRGVTLNFSGPKLAVITDAGRLKRIVQNLVENAIKYMPAEQNGQVNVSWQKTAQGFRIVVADNGAGIPESIERDLFRPFAKHATGGAGSVGLGLSIVRRMTESLRGQVTVLSSAKGATFTLDFPEDYE